MDSPLQNRLADCRHGSSHILSVSCRTLARICVVGDFL